MRLKIGNIYYVKDEFFDIVKNSGLMLNHEKLHARPNYLAFKEGELLWLIPLSSKIKKYENIINSKISKYGKCSGILIRSINNRESVILIQNAFPILECFLSIGIPIRKINASLKKEIFDNFKYLLELKKIGHNLFFPDIDKIKEEMLKLLEKHDISYC